MWKRRFEWDQYKAASNVRRHGISFDEARTIFEDQFAFIFDDEAHSSVELREIIIGHSVNNRLLLTVFVERETAIRLISARRPTLYERRKYERNRTDY